MAEINCIFWMREMLNFQLGTNLSLKHMRKRLNFTTLGGRRAMEFDLSGLPLVNGLDRPDCGHGSRANQATGDIIFHGTKDLVGIINSRGVMKSGHRRKTHGKGWSCDATLSAHFALKYGRPVLFGSEHHTFRPLLKLRSKCYLQTKTTGWFYCRKDCLRYTLEKIVLVSQSFCTDVPVF